MIDLVELRRQGVSESTIKEIAEEYGITVPAESPTGGMKDKASVSSRTPVERGTPEADFEQSIVDLARRLGFRVLQVRRSRQKRNGTDIYVTPWGADGKGWPDDSFFHPITGKFFVAEFKSQKGVLSAEQKEWLATLRACGILCFTWRPSDMDVAIETVTKLANRSA